VVEVEGWCVIRDSKVLFIVNEEKVTEKLKGKGVNKVGGTREVQRLYINCQKGKKPHPKSAKRALHHPAR
jgi:hypothetical protein